MTSDLPTSNTVAGRLERQALDDGAPSDTVYRLPRSCPSSSGGWQTPKIQGHVYHEDRDCRHIEGRSEVEDDTRAGAQERNLAPCALCVLGESYGQENAESKHRCPFCDTPVNRLPSHLPCEESP